MRSAMRKMNFILLYKITNVTFSRLNELYMRTFLFLNNKSFIRRVTNLNMPNVIFHKITMNNRRINFFYIV